jgi:hypothetical protein
VVRILALTPAAAGSTARSIRPGTGDKDDEPVYFSIICPEKGKRVLV